MAKFSIKYRKKGTKTWKRWTPKGTTMPLKEAEAKIKRLKVLEAKTTKWGFRTGIRYGRKHLPGKEFEFKLKKWGK
jgi:hypothetical protein